MVQYGINLNPRHPVGQPNDLNALQGVKWARIVFQASAARQSIDEAFSFYDPIVDKYNAIGMKTLMVINQEMFWGHGPWDHGDWDRYARDFAEATGKVVAHYKGKGMAYEIWNEGDIRGHSSVYVPPNEFAKVLNAAAAAVKANDPGAIVVFGGLAEAPGNAIPYVQAVQAALGGKLPVDAIGIHPYGKWTPNFSSNPGWGGWFGPLDNDIQMYVNAFPLIPLWMTEVGVSEEVNFPPEQYPMVSKFMQGVYDLVQTRFARNIPVVIWFAWSDIMRQAGIVDINNNPKGQVYQKFQEIVKAAAGTATPVITPDSPDTETGTQKGVIVAPTADSLSVRDGAGTSNTRLTLVNTSDRLVALEDPKTVANKIGKTGEWLNIRTPDGTEGWSAAWYLKLAGIIFTCTVSLNVRSGPGTKYDKLDLVQPGDNLMGMEPLAEIAMKIGKQRKWIQIRAPSGKTGWAAAWYLKL